MDWNTSNMLLSIYSHICSFKPPRYWEGVRESIILKTNKLQERNRHLSVVSYMNCTSGERIVRGAFSYTEVIQRRNGEGMTEFKYHHFAALNE